MRPLGKNLTAALLLLALQLPIAVGATGSLRFFAVGDLPYSPSEEQILASLLVDVARGRPRFLAHIGDVKSGSSPCTERSLGRAAELFKVQSVPVVYTPGDNEWTDCHRPGAGGYDPLERLTRLRHLYFADPNVLRLDQLGVTRTDAEYPENYWFIRGGVVFATVHLVGSHNNSIPEDAAATDELLARSQANQRHLRAAVKAANEADAAAFVLLFHANPGLEQPRPPRGFEWFHQDLAALLRNYPGPVLVIHGDTHKFRYDHPLRDLETGRVIQRFTRLEVPGSPGVAGVWVRVESGADEPFSVELAYPDARRHLVE